MPVWLTRPLLAAGSLNTGLAIRYASEWFCWRQKSDTFAHRRLLALQVLTG